MRHISMHIMDLIMNSINANADLIEVTVNESSRNSRVDIEVRDNGCAIAEENLKDVFNPFYTTDKNKSTGMGLSLLKETAERTGGYVKIKSEKGKGTAVTASYDTSSVDFMGTGDINKSLALEIVTNPNIRFIIVRQRDEEKIILDTKKYKDGPIELPDYRGILNFLNTI